MSRTQCWRGDEEIGSKGGPEQRNSREIAWRTAKVKSAGRQIDGIEKASSMKRKGKNQADQENRARSLTIK